MSLNEAMVSSASHHWCSPNEILDPVRDLNGGPIDFDPCSNPASIVGAEVELMIERGDDGLSVSWVDRGLGYQNPPFGRALGVWMHKTCVEADAGAETVTLTPSRTGSGWCQSLLQRSDAHCFLRGRLKFIGTRAPELVGDDGKKGPVDWSTITAPQLEALAHLRLVVVESAPFDCVVGYFGPRPLRFRRAFRSLGIVEVHPRRRRGAWHCQVRLVMGDNRERWQPLERMRYRRAREEADLWRARGYQTRLVEADAGGGFVAPASAPALVRGDRQRRLFPEVA